jgi:AAA domain
MAFSDQTEVGYGGPKAKGGKGGNGGGPGGQPRDPNWRRFRLERFADLQASTAPPYLIRGIIPRTGIVVVWGAPKCGKTFKTHDMLMHVAIGWDYRGRRVKRGAVVYLAAEGATGLRARTEAWRQKHLSENPDRDVPFFLIDAQSDLAHDAADLIAAIRSELADAVPAVVVIDTLNRTINGSENKDEDMGRFIKAADIIQRAFDCVVVIIHHCGVATNRPRGHTSLTGAADAQIAVERDNTGLVTMTVEYMKDGESGTVIMSRLELVKLCDDGGKPKLDDDGEPITSCVVVEAPAAPAGKAAGKSASKTTPNQRRFIDILRAAILEAPADLKGTATVPNGAQAVTRDTLKKYLVAKGWMEEAETNRARAKVSGMLNVLAGKNLIGLTNMYVWMP